MAPGSAADPTARGSGPIIRSRTISICSAAARCSSCYNTARTEIGEETLADWLRAPAPAPTVVERQQAVGELRPMLDFREGVAVLAAEADVGRTGALADVGKRRRRSSFPRWAGRVLRRVRRGHARARSRVPCRLDRMDLGRRFHCGSPIDRIRIWRAQVARVLSGIETPERDLALASALLERSSASPSRRRGSRRFATR